MTVKIPLRWYITILCTSCDHLPALTISIDNLWPSCVTRRRRVSVERGRTKFYGGRVGVGHLFVHGRDDGRRGWPEVTTTTGCSRTPETTSRCLLPPPKKKKTPGRTLGGCSFLFDSANEWKSMRFYNTRRSRWSLCRRGHPRSFYFIFLHQLSGGIRLFLSRHVPSYDLSDRYYILQLGHGRALRNDITDLTMFRLYKYTDVHNIKAAMRTNFVTKFKVK